MTARSALRLRSPFLAFVAAPPVVLLAAHLLPATGPGLALRLAGAAACVFLLPGALLLRAAAWPSSLGVAVAGSFVLSLAVVALGLAIVFAVGSSIVLAGIVVLIVSACAGVPAALRGNGSPVPRAERRSLAAVLGLSLPLAGAVWWTAGPFVGDTYFHVARVRKLDELDTLGTLATVTEFQDGGIHPGYAFPLLHGAEALVARLGGVDPTDVVLYLPAILVPLCLVLVYAAGATVFRSWAGGLALVAAQVAQMGLSRRSAFFEGTGFFETLSQPQAASVMLLAPAIVALAFTFIVEGGWASLAALACGAFVLAAVHPTYAPYVALVLAGFVLARVVLVRGWDPLLTRAACAVGAILVPFGFLLLLLLPAALDSPAVTPSEALRAAQLELNRKVVVEVGDWIAYAPSAIARGGPAVVAGLLAVPLAGLAARRLWAALVLGGSLAVLAVLLTPPLFTVLSDLFSLSQSRRLLTFLPIAFAVAGGCVVVSRFRAAGVVLAGALGVSFVLLYPGEFTRQLEQGGPVWAVVAAVAGAVGALVAGALLRPRGPNPDGWAVAAAVAFVVPVAVAALPVFHKEDSITDLTPEIVDAARSHVSPGDVLFSDQESAFAIAAFAPVYINAGPIGNVTATGPRSPGERAADSRRFLSGGRLTDEGRRRILERYDADWVLVDTRRPSPESFLETLELVFADDRYRLYRVSG